MKQVEMIANVEYLEINDSGLKIKVVDEVKTLDVDNVVICAGQEPLEVLSQDLNSAGIVCHVIGGALNAVELDAKRAIYEASHLAAKI